MTIHQALTGAQARLERAGVPDAAHDAAWLMGSLLGLSRLSTLARGTEPISVDTQAQFERLVQRREKREPLQYILGETAFMGHRVLCRPGVLIPRNDSEILCQQAIARLDEGQRALDLCCGSGAIALSLKLARPEAEVWASDLSEQALALARDNAALHDANVNFCLGDLFAPLKGLRFHLIACNPPYIPSAALISAQPELQYEPALALDGGMDGLDLCRPIFIEAPRYLEPGGWLLIEMGDGQAEALRAMAHVDFGTIKLYDDYAGLPRVMAAQWKGPDAFAG